MTSDGSERSARIERAILRALLTAERPLGAAKIAEHLAERGIDLQPRSVRYHLSRTDRAGWTRLVDRRHGRRLTELGAEEARRVNAEEKLGFIAARMDDLGYRMTFDLRTMAGSVVANTALLSARDLSRAVPLLEPVLRARLAMGSRIALARESERLAGLTVPADQIALGTMCSITVNGILLKLGIPVTSRYGGLLELVDGRPRRFVELIEYRGTTVDPLELFIRAGLTRVQAAARTGRGLVGASVREIPAMAVPEVLRVRRELQDRDVHAILEVGRPGRPLLDVAISEGRAGILVLGGLNAFAALVEAGVPVQLQPLAGLENLRAFRPYREIASLARPVSPLLD
ncbi:MAG: NrpR regulatory domain-containing protein [Kiritimatiellae bacterium]|nr:NrpR regulatory domain-containing protein [Kiritimatiellia bacterium]